MKKSQVQIVSKLSVDSLNFIFNLEEILHNRKNPLDYRFEILKVENVFDSNYFIANVIDNKLKKKYKIPFNDYYIKENNPCISLSLYQRILNYKYYQRTFNNDAYKNHYLKYLKQKVLQTYLKFYKSLSIENRKKIVPDKFLFNIEKSLKATSLNIVFYGNFNDFLHYLKSEDFTRFLQTTETFLAFKNNLDEEELKFELKQIEDSIFINNTNFPERKFRTRLQNYLKDAKIQVGEGQQAVMKTLAKERREKALDKKLKTKKTHYENQEM